MAKVVVMPKLGLTMTEGTVSSWLKKEGDEVKEGEPLFEVETDKLTNTIEATASGVLRKIIVAAGATVPVLDKVAVIAAADEDISGLLSGGAAPAAEAAPAAADGNRVTLRENGDSGSITGGSADGYGSGSASKNTVTILGQVRGDVTGGAEGEHGSGTEVAGNVVNLLKGSIEGNVYGGRSNLGTAVQNKVNFYGGSVGGTIYAGAIGDGGALSPAAAENENQLNIYGQELAAGNILGMSSLNFYLPNDAAAGTVLLRLTAAEDVDLSGVSIGADLDNGAGAGLSAGDTIALLVANGRILADGDIANAAETLHPIARSHGLRLSVSPDGHTLLATVTEAVEP